MAILRTPRSLYTACERCEQYWRPLSENMLRGHPQRGIYRLMSMLAVPSAVNSAGMTANMSARRRKRSAKSRV